MKKHRILLILFTFITLSPCLARAAEQVDLGDSAFASVITCGPGDEFYESFGHSALRICDPANNIDIVFNYGIFDFNTDFFYLKFARGQLDYCLAMNNFGNFIVEYDYFGRAVWEQRLHISHDELIALFNNLLVNARPENKYYKYDFFRDNCATRVRDMVDSSIAEGNRLVVSDAKRNTTYRDLIYKYTGDGTLWWRLGVDLLLGARCDMRITDTQQMYIPIEMMNQLDTALNTNGNTLTDNAVTLLSDKRESASEPVTPQLCFLLLLIAVVLLTLVAIGKGWRLTWLDATLFAVAGLVSLLLLFLWFGSDHWCTKWNLNLLWANPLYLWLLCRLRKPGRKVTIAALACIALMVLVWIVGWPQAFNSSVMLFALTLAVRLFHRLKSYGK